MKSPTSFIWETHEALEVLTIRGEVIASIFPWAGAWGVAFQDDEMKTARHKYQARAYAERGAYAHFAKMNNSDPEFVPDHRDLNRRDHIENLKKQKAAALAF